VFGKKWENVKKINIVLSFGECVHAVWYIRKKKVLVRENMEDPSTHEGWVATLRALLWGVVALEILGDVLLVAASIWSSADEPEQLDDILNMWMHPLSVLGSLFYARIELWEIQEEESEEERGKRSRNRASRVSRILVFIILFSVMPMSDLFTLISYIRANNFESDTLSSYTIFVASFLLLVSVLCWLWVAASSIILLSLSGKSSYSPNLVRGGVQGKSIKSDARGRRGKQSGEFEMAHLAPGVELFDPPFASANESSLRRRPEAPFL